MLYGCNYCVELNVLSGYMYCYRFELPIPDRNRYVPFPTYRNIDFVFPSAFPISVPVPERKKKTRTVMVRGFSRSFPTVFNPIHQYNYKPIEKEVDA